MAAPRILGPDGQPIQIKALTEEVATPSLTSVRQVWSDSIASGLTPAALAALLQGAADGNPHDYLTLAEEMEERDPHYAAVLGVRKRAVSGLPVMVEAASDDAADVKRADAVRELVARPEFIYLVEDLLDGLGKGYAVCELLWNRGAQWTPAAYVSRDPRWFQFDRETRRELRLVDASDPINGAPLPPYKFIVHTPRLKSGLPIRAGLARIAAFAWICKAYIVKDAMAFAEVFGIPLRLGRYGPNASKDDVAILKSAVASIGSDAAAVLPESMKIEFQQAANVSGARDVFLGIAEFLDRQISKAVLGQTSTADAQAAGLGSNQASVHNEIREDILKADARQLSDTLNRDLLRPYIDLNFGPQVRYPRLQLHVPEPEDVKALVDNVVKLLPFGLKVGMSTMRDKIGMPDPDKDEELLAAPAVAPPPALNARTALNAARPAADPTNVDRQAGRLEQETQAAIGALMEPVRALLERSASLEEFRDGLLALYPQMDAGGVAQLLEQGLIAAQLMGRYELLEGL